MPAPPSRFSTLRRIATVAPPIVAVPIGRAVQRGCDCAETRERRCVGTGTAVEDVDDPGAIRTRIQRVVACAARDRVRVRVAGQVVVERRTQQVLEPAEVVCSRVDGVLTRALQGQADRHARRGTRIGSGVIADAADQRVVAESAFDDVVVRRHRSACRSAPNRPDSRCRSACPSRLRPCPGLRPAY